MLSSEVASFCCGLLLCAMVEIDWDRKGKFLLQQLEQKKGSRSPTKGGREGGKEGNEDGVHHFSKQEEDNNPSSHLVEKQV